MLVCRHHVLVAWDPWQGARRDAALGELVALVGTRLVTSLHDQAGAVDVGVHVEQSGVDGGRLVGDEQVGEDHRRQLVLLGEVEHQGDGLEAVERAGRCVDEFGEVSLTGAEHLPQVALLRLGGHTGRGTGALHVDDHDGYLHHGGGADRLGHQREAATGGGAHGAAAGMRRSDGHADDADLVLHLTYHDAQFAGVGRHPV